MESAPLFPSGKRRGRHPVTKNKHSSLVAMRKRPPPITMTLRSSSPPSQPVFRCRWKLCSAQLHNLATLRKHVGIVHRPAESETQERGEYICWWEKCSLHKADADDTIQPTRIFPTQDKWLAHIDEEHLYPIGLKLGDGPSTAHIDPQSLLQDRARYLADQHGRATTPAISMKIKKDLPTDTLTLMKVQKDEADVVAHRSFLKAHTSGKMNPKTSAVETLRAMEARKVKLGPGIDRGGCTLVNEARRSTLIQNQGLARVIDPDDD